jgi:hypothetical protein
MSDELMLPQVPEAKPEDPEDVSWALSTAEAMWARGDHSEGIKWVRRAAEAASEAEFDARALELAKAAAELAGLVTRRLSRASIDLEEIEPVSEAAPPPVPPARPASPANPPPKPVGSMAPRPLPTSVTRQVATPSRPPAPLPSRTSQPPPPGTRPSQAPKGRPLGSNTASKPASVPGETTAQRAAQEKKTSRKSRDNLDAEARAAVEVADTARQLAVDEKTAGAVLPADTSETAAIEVPHRRGPAEIGSNDPTVIGRVDEVLKPTGRSTDEWDASPTQNLAGEELLFGEGDGDRKTVAGAPATDFKATIQSFPRPGAKPAGVAASPGAAPANGGGTSPPTSVAGAMLTQGALAAAPAVRGGTNERHDPAITTSQAVRVVVWRDANGVHVAPAGTVVSAITVDAMLVALEPSADLTAWLTQKGR